jgi:hypothetical protein
MRVDVPDGAAGAEPAGVAHRGGEAEPLEEAGPHFGVEVALDPFGQGPWPSPLGAALNAALPLFDRATGACVDPSAQFQLETVGRQVVEFPAAREEINK